MLRPYEYCIYINIVTFLLQIERQTKRGPCRHNNGHGATASTRPNRGSLWHRKDVHSCADSQADIEAGGDAGVDLRTFEQVWEHIYTNELERPFFTMNIVNSQIE